MNSNQPPLYKSLLASAEEVQAKIEELAREVIKKYKGQRPLFVCLLRGGAPFASQLMFAISRQDPYFYPEMDYMTIKTYGEGRVENPAELVMDLSPATAAAGRHAILLDDVLDKGITAEFAKNTLMQKHGVANVDCIVLIQKNHPREHFGDATMYGFESPPDWLTGMGLDDTRLGVEANRWAGFIAIAAD